MSDLPYQGSGAGDAPRRRRVAHTASHQGDQDPQVRRLVRRLGELEAEVAVIAQALAGHTPQRGDDAGPVNRDARWHCQKCGYLLGFYDKDQDVLRTRYKEHIVFVRAGPGGFVQIVCRGCSEVNTQQYVEPGGGAEQPGA